MKTLGRLGIAALLAALPLVAHAQGKETKGEGPTDREVAETTGQKTEDVEKAAQKGFGVGEITISAAIAKASGKPLADILVLKQSGKGWGEICKDLGIKLGPLMKEAHANVKALSEKHPKNTGLKETEKDLRGMMEKAEHDEGREHRRMHENMPMGHGEHPEHPAHPEHPEPMGH